MKVYEAVANAFVKEGVTTVFGLMGDGNMTWAAAMTAKPGMRVIDVRDEGAALSMADGYARATGKVGVCNVTHGPGITRMATSLVAGVKARVPAVIYTSRTHFNNEWQNQSLNQDRFVTATGAGFNVGAGANLTLGVIAGNFNFFKSNLNAFSSLGM